MRGLLTLGVFLTGLVLGPVPGTAEGPLIESLQIRGTRRPLEMETHAGQTLDLGRIERDVHRLWATGWFDDIRVDSSEPAPGLQLTFTLVERPRLYLRRVVFQPARERRPLDLDKRASVDVTLARRVAGELQRQLVEEGYADAKVDPDLVPVGFEQADLHLRVEPGRLYRVEDVRFSGSTGLEPRVLRQALRSTRSRLLLPGLGPLWPGWRWQAPFSEQRLQADVERLRSLYSSRGYFDVDVKAGGVAITNRRATVTIEVNSGQRYHVGQLQVGETQIQPRADGVLPTRTLCRCLEEARRDFERRGQVASASLQVTPAEEPPAAVPTAVTGPWVALNARIEAGPPNRVGRIEFRGNRAVSDALLRRALVLQEGDWFDRARLSRSLERLSQFRFIEPVRPAAVRTEVADGTRLVNLTIHLKEKRLGIWSLSGPLGPVSALGPLQYKISSRLPAFGRDSLDLSTYYASVSLMAWPSLLAGRSALAVLSGPLIALERPYLPGQGWQSGFLLSPKWRWKSMAAFYGLTHVEETARAELGIMPVPSLSVPVAWGTAETNGLPTSPRAGLLQCEEPTPPSARLWRLADVAAAVATDWLLTSKRP